MVYNIDSYWFEGEGKYLKHETFNNIVGNISGNLFRLYVWSLEKKEIDSIKKHHTQNSIVIKRTYLYSSKKIN